MKTKTSFVGRFLTNFNVRIDGLTDDENKSTYHIPMRILCLMKVTLPVHSTFKMNTEVSTNELFNFFQRGHLKIIHVLFAYLSVKLISAASNILLLFSFSYLIDLMEACIRYITIKFVVHSS